MRIVIDINESDYKTICDYIKAVEANSGEFVKCWYSLPMRFEDAIYHGTPLPDNAIIIDAKEQSDYVFVEKAKYNDLVEAASKALTDRIKKSLYEGVIAESEAESEDKE